MLQTKQPFFILSRCFLTTTFLLPLNRNKTLEQECVVDSARAGKGAVTCAGDDHVHPSDHFLHFHHPEAVHADQTQH